MIEQHGQRFECIKGRNFLQGIISGHIAEEHKEHIKKVFDDYGKIITDEMIKLVSTGSRSGRIYFYKGQAYQSSAPGEPPAKRSGALAEAFGYSASWDELVIWNDIKYALYLDSGTRKMNARPFFLTVIAKYDGQIKEALQNYLGD
jgi:hypothetical protein